MKVGIAGAGKVGRSIARELLANGHTVLLLDRDANQVVPGSIPGATMYACDACEVDSLEKSGLADCQVVVAATGDDKVNLVVSLLAKTEFAVPRVVARVNHPKNEWMFDESWGVDTAVSTPRILSALVEEAVAVGDLVRLLTFRQGDANLVELTLPATASVIGCRVGDVTWPQDTAITAIVRDGRVIAPSVDDTLEAGDEVFFISTDEQEQALAALLTSDA